MQMDKLTLKAQEALQSAKGVAEKRSHQQIDVAGIMKLGIQPTEAWYTVYGVGSQILTGAIAEDLPTLKAILVSDDWRRLKTKLFDYVTNFDSKIVRATGRFQML